MIRMIPATLTAIALVIATSSATIAAAPASVEAIPNARKAPSELPVTWDHIPYDRMKQKYPSVAKQRSQPGSVLVSCDWDDSGRVTGCELIRETPEGYGFGAATLEIMKGATVKSKVADEPIESGKGLKLFVNWKQ